MSMPLRAPGGIPVRLATTGEDRAKGAGPLHDDEPASGGSDDTVQLFTPVGDVEDPEVSVVVPAVNETADHH